MGASDIHLEPWGNEVSVRFRVDGVLRAYDDFPRTFDLKRLIIHWKYKVDRLGKPGLPLDGRLLKQTGFDDVEFRVSFIPVMHGDKVVLRIFDHIKTPLDLESLGIRFETRSELSRLVARRTGAILFTGPTGSGKTTVMYALLRKLVRDSKSSMSISTVEDPIESEIHGAAQSEVNLEKGFDYPRALRSVLRQDPEVIMIGEIRDRDTAEIAMSAGHTGHLVFSTVHAPNTAGVFPRLIGMGVEPFLLLSAVVGVMGVRLFRMNCKNCLDEYEPDEKLFGPWLKRVRERRVREPNVDKKFYHGSQRAKNTGEKCEHCKGGYRGREALSEVLLTEWVETEILEKADSTRIHRAVKDRMKSLEDDGTDRVCGRKTTIEEMARVLGTIR